MKKAIISFITLLCLLIAPCAVFAQESIFYYDFSDKELNELLPEIVKLQTEWTALELVDQGELKYSRDENRNKIEIKTDEMFCDYDWTVKQLADFFEAKDKNEFLRTMKAKKYYYPVYYDGKQLKNVCATISYNPKDELPYLPMIMKEKEINQTARLFQNRGDLQAYLADNGFGGYIPLLTIHYWQYWFCYVTNGEEESVIYLYTDMLYPPKLFTATPNTVFAVDEFLEYLTDFTNNTRKSEALHTTNKTENNKVASSGSSSSVEEIADLDSATQKENISKNETDTQIDMGDQFVQNSETAQESNQPQDFDEEQYPKGQPLLWVIGGAVVLVGGVLTVVLIRKKKKIR